MRSFKKSYVLLIILVSLLAGSLLLYALFRRGPKTIGQQIINTLMAAGYPLQTAKMWLAVALHESGAFTSNVFKGGLNPWGMTPATKRPTTQNGSYGNFGNYDSIQDGINDIVLYQKYFGYPKAWDSLSDLVKFMKSKNYFGDQDADSYLAALQNRFNQVDSFLFKQKTNL